jgi:probable HAF family extracellular repeat protein
MQLMSLPLHSPQPAPAAWAAPCFDVQVLDAHSSLAATLRRPVRGANRWGQHVGAVGHPGQERAALFDRRGVRELGLLQAGDTASRALAINDAAQVVGFSRRGLHEHAFIWQDGSMRGLGEWCSTTGSQALQASRARAINSRGQVVGRAATADRVFGFWWTPRGGLLELGPLLAQAPGQAAWQIADATELDDQGRIFATGVCEGRYHDLLLQPRPEFSGDKT